MLSDVNSSTIPFNRATYFGSETEFVQDAGQQPWLSGGGKYTKLCETRAEEMLGCQRAFLAPSCTAALEMAARILGIGPGDEVIVPSFTFVTSASAFAIFGARLVFVDIEPETMNMDPRAVEQAITPRTKAIVPVHYAGVVCDMDAIMSMADQHGIPVVEDAAQAIGASRNGRPAGSFGALAAFSFHETKNITSGGEGGLLAVNARSLLDRAKIIRDKGTNRAAFREGLVDKYSWVALGSSYLMNEISAAWLWPQLDNLEQINKRRCVIEARYAAAFEGHAKSGRVKLSETPTHCVGNGHIFYLKLRDLAERTAFIAYLASKNIHATFHYVPLHTSQGGQKYGCFAGQDTYTSTEAERLVRLPLFYNMSDAQQDRVISAALEFLSLNAPPTG